MSSWFPSKAALALGEPWGINFARRGHDYAVRFHRSGLEIACDGQKVRRWDDLPAAVQKVIVKARDNFGPSLSL